MDKFVGYLYENGDRRFWGKDPFSWTKCSDELPPKDETVVLLWFDKLSETGGYEYCHGFGTPDEYDNTLDAITDGCVVGWMRLPAKPDWYPMKEEESNDQV
jgi:hypothetical protein